MGPENSSRAPSALEKVKKISQRMALTAVVLASSVSPSEAQSTPKAGDLSTPPIKNTLQLPDESLQLESRADLGSINIVFPKIDPQPVELAITQKPSVEELKTPQKPQITVTASTPEPRVSANRFKEAEQPRGIWDLLSEECESGGDWSANTGNGYYGGLQFDTTTWAAYGGSEFASRADLASREQQIVVAERVAVVGFGHTKPQGMAAWPMCSLKLGLR